MNILVFDIEITGHHPEYIDHLVQYIYNLKNNTHNYCFIVHPDFCERFPEIVGKRPNPEISFIPITYFEFNDLYTYRDNNSSHEIIPFKIYNLLIKYANTIKPDRCILMYFNRFFKPLVFKRPKFEIYGILFSPFIRIPNHHNSDSKIKYFRKRILRFLYTRNTKIKKLFILNDKTAVAKLNKQTNKNVYCYLPDPIPVFSEENNFDLRDKYKIIPSKKILLHFGSLRDSKGTIELIQSLNLLSSEASETCCLIISGKPKDSNMERRIHESIRSVKQVQIIYINVFLSSSKMKSFFNQSDIILMPYKNSMASSGVIGHAIAAEKPVISTQHGLIGEIIKTNWKGELIDLIEPKTIANAIEKSIFTDYPEISNYNYIKEHTPSNFAQTILEYDEVSK